MSFTDERMREAAKRESDLAAIEAVLGADARREMEAYLGIFDERFYTWLAGLYDPATGALYY